MKKSFNIKNMLLFASAVVGTQVVTSCNSCDRKQGQTTDGTETIHDTVYVDTCMSPYDTLRREGATGAYVPMGSGGAKASASRPAAGSKPTAGTSGGGKQLTQEEIDNRVENSGSSAAMKNGKPVNSGGTAGSGQGTGTGSTGNNSRVTTKEDQLRN